MATQIKNNDLFEIPSKKDNSPTVVSDTIYCLYGKHDFLHEGFPIIDGTPEDSRACAYVRVGKQKHYYVKVGKHAKYYNPMESLGPPLRRQDPHGYKFKEVTKDSFEHYIKFLKTKNKLHLSYAEREGLK